MNDIISNPSIYDKTENLKLWGYRRSFPYRRVHPIFRFWSLLVTKLQNYYVIFVYILQSKMEFFLKWPKYQKPKYGMNKTKVTFLDGELKSNRRQPCSCLNWCSIDKTWHKGPSGVKSKKWRTCKKIFFIRNYLEETFLRRIRKRNDHVITCWNKNELTGSLGNGGFLAPLPRQSSWNWIICEINWAKDFAVGGSLWTCWKY